MMKDSSRYDALQSSSNKLERGFHEMLFFFMKGQPYNRLVYVQYIFMFIQMSSELISMDFAWSKRVIYMPSYVLRVIALDPRLMNDIDASHTLFLFVFILVSIYLVIASVFVTYIAYSFASSTFTQIWMANTARTMTSVTLTMQVTMMNIAMSQITCAPSSSSSIASFCTAIDGAGYKEKILLIIGSLNLCMIVYLACIAALMHRNDPTCLNVSSRTHSRFELAWTLSVFILIIAKHVLLGFPSFVTLLVFCATSLQLIVHVIHQPFYYAHVNHMRSALYAALSWTALCVEATIQVNDVNDDVIASLFISCLPSSLYIGYRLSSHYLSKCVRQGESKHTDKQLLDHNYETMMFKQLRQSYVQGLSVQWSDAWNASIIEVTTRFIITNPTTENMDKCECILKRALVQYPQSIYLRFQYMSFIVAYRQNYTNSSTRYDEFVWLPASFDQRFSMYLYKQGYQKFMHDEAGMMANDRISIEEIKRMRKTATRAHREAFKTIQLVWKMLARGQTNTSRLTRLVESIHQAEECAMKSFNYLMARVNESTEITRNYADFLDQVKGDHASAKKLRKQIAETEGDYTGKSLLNRRQSRRFSSRTPGAALENKTIPTSLSSSLSTTMTNQQPGRQNSRRLTIQRSSSIKKSSGMGFAAFIQAEEENENATATTSTNRVTKADRHEQLKRKRVKSLKTKMRLVSLVLVLITSAVLGLYMLLSSNYITTLINTSDSGIRRRYAISAAVYSRGMHIAALRDDTNEFQLQSRYLSESMQRLWTMHTQLTRTYRPSLAEHWSWYMNPTVDVREPNSMNQIEIITLSGYDVIAQLVDKAKVIVNQTMSELVDFQSNIPRSNPEFYFIQENAPVAARAMDISTTFYQIEAENYAELMQYLIVCSSVLSVMIEALVVLCVFRPAVIKVFDEFTEVVEKLSTIPAVKAQEIVNELDITFNHHQMKTTSTTASNKNHANQRDRNVIGINSVLEEEHNRIDQRSEGSDSSDAPIAENDNDDDKAADNDIGGIDSKTALLDDEDKKGTSKNKRRHQVTLTYILCLGLMSAIMLAYCIFVVSTVNESMSFASELNNSGRKSYLARRMAYFARELALSTNNQTSLTGGSLQFAQDDATIRCQLVRSAHTLLQVHYFLLYQRRGWYEAAASRQFDALTPQTNCSPLSWMDKNFQSSLREAGSFHVDQDSRNIYFENNCFASLSWRDQTNGAASNKRIQAFSREFDSGKCIFYGEADPRMMFGSQRLLEEQVELGLMLAKTPISQLNINLKYWQQLSRYESGSEELHLSMAKSVLTYEFEAVKLIESSKENTIVLISAIYAVIFFQSFFLGKRIEILMSQNIGMGFIIKRLISKTNPMGARRQYSVSIK